MRSFAHMFQIECARNRPIFFLGTGLYENIEALSDENDLTFLHRAPCIVLNPLDNISVARSYQNIFGISEEKARDMAMLVKGYSFAFQALGYLYWEKGKSDDRLFLRAQTPYDVSREEIARFLFFPEGTAFGVLALMLISALRFDVASDGLHRHASCCCRKVGR